MGNRGVEDEEADLVFGYVDRVLEKDWCPLPCQVLCSAARPFVASIALARLRAGEIRLDEISGHAFDARTAPERWKRPNV